MRRTDNEPPAVDAGDDARRPGRALARDIGVALALKTLAIAALYLLYFSHPTRKSITPVVMADHLVHRPSPAQR
jgi:hypothetical protein